MLRRSEIDVRGGMLKAVHIIGADDRWLIDPAEARSGTLMLTGRPKQIHLTVSGSGQARVRLGTDGDHCDFTLNDVLAAWRSRSDRYDPLAMEFGWPARQAKVTVELVSAWQAKTAISEDFKSLIL